MQRYASYKSSAIPWVDELPQHWGEEKGKWLHRFRKDLNNRKQCNNVLSLTLRGVVNNDPEDPEGLVPKDYGTYQIFEKDDLVFKLIDLENFRTSRVGLVHERGIMSPAYLRVQPGKQHNPRYFYYYYFTLYQQGIYNKLGAGVRSTLGPTDLLEIGVPVPSKEEQDRIVAFLDQKTAEIDDAIAKKERLIELIKEQKKTFVEHLVCRGLGSGIPTRNSGVDSVGTIPEHWRVKKLGHLANVVRGASPRPAGDPRYFSSEEGVSWVTVAEVTKDEMLYLRETKEFLTPVGARQSQAFHRGTVIFTNSGATLGVPKILDIDCCANDGILALKRFSCEANKEFLYYFLSTTTERLREEMKQGGGQPNLNTGIVKSIAVSLPPVQEQLEIVRCINLYLGKQQTLLCQTRASIEQLQKLKETLIAEVVAGKFKV